MHKRRKQIRWIALLALTAAALYVCWLILMPFLEVLAWAVVLVIIFFPAHKHILARVKNPSLSALLSTLVVIIAIMIPLGLIAVAIVRETSGVSQQLQNNVSVLLDPRSPTTGRMTRWLEHYVDVDHTRLQAYITDRLKSFSEYLAERSIGFAGNIVNGVIEFFFIIFVVYYLFRDSLRIRAAMSSALPLQRVQAKHIFERTGEVINASVSGVIIISVINGTLGGLAFWALGLPAPVLWGVMMMLLSMIPSIGTLMVWVPAAIYLAVKGHWVSALILSLWCSLAIGAVDNFFRPKLVSQRVNLHELLIFFSVLGGLQVFGMLGIVLGPVVVAFTLSLLEVFREIDRPAKITLLEPTLMEEQSELRDAS